MGSFRIALCATAAAALLGVVWLAREWAIRTPGLQCPTGKQAVDVVLISIDTLRRDHLGFYGYSRPTSPHLDALSTTGTVFEQAVSVHTNTAPVHASLLTGLYPHSAGAGHMGANLGTPAYQGCLRNDSATIAEVLRESGYRTSGFPVNGQELKWW